MAYFALIGNSLKHSFSATYFNQKFKDEGLAHEYGNIELDHIEYLPDILALPDLGGLNVTIPYKVSVIPYLAGLTLLAEKVGAVNTIFKHHGKWYGHNTDYIGFTSSLLAWAWSNNRGDLFKEKRKALVLGNGGAAMAVKLALDGLGFTYDIAVRQPDPLSAEPLVGYPDLVGRLHQYGLIINTTPVGTWPNVADVLPIPLAELAPQHHIADLIYNPAVTKLMEVAMSQGATATNGYDMLVSQALAAWAVWTGEVDGFEINPSSPS